MTDTSSIDPLSSLTSQNGRTLDELSRSQPLLVVCLRHGGCAFCREALSEISQSRAGIEQAGARIALVHMMSDADAANLFERYGLDGMPRVSDPKQQLYRAFGFKRGSIGAVLGPRVWWSGFKTTVLGGHVPGKPVGDVMQLPGAVLLVDGEVRRSFHAETSADKPDYIQFAQQS
jgi:hypothetical protein